MNCCISSGNSVIGLLATGLDDDASGTLAVGGLAVDGPGLTDDGSSETLREPDRAGDGETAAASCGDADVLILSSGRWPPALFTRSIILAFVGFTAAPNSASWSKGSG